MKMDVSGRKYEVKVVEACNRLNKRFDFRRDSRFRI